MSWKQCQIELENFNRVYDRIMALQERDDNLYDIRNFLVMVGEAGNTKYTLPTNSSKAFAKRLETFVGEKPFDLEEVEGRLRGSIRAILYFKEEWREDISIDNLADLLSAFDSPPEIERPRSRFSPTASRGKELRDLLQKLKQDLKSYVKVLQKYVLLLSPGPSKFQWEGFHIENPEQAPDAAIYRALDGIKEGVELFKKRGLSKLLYEGLNVITLELHPERGSEGGAIHGMYRPLNREIILKTDALNVSTPRLYTRWFTEVFIHEFGHHIHLNMLPQEAKDFWDSGWQIVDERTEDLKITRQDRQSWLRIFERNNYDIQKTGRALPRIQRIVFQKILHELEFLTTPRQLRLTKKAKLIQEVLRRGALGEPPEFYRVNLREPVIFEGDSSVQKATIQSYVNDLALIFGELGYDLRLPPSLLRVTEEEVARYRDSGNIFKEVDKAKDSLGIPSEYGRTNVKEDFAETFVLFVAAPEKLTETARWRMGRTLGMSESLGTPIMRLSKRVASRYIKVARPIPLPRAEIFAAIEDLLRQANQRTRGFKSEDPVGEHRRLGSHVLTFTNVRGEHDVVTIYLVSEHSSANVLENTFWGGAGRRKGTNNKVIVIYMHSGVTKYAISSDKSYLRDKFEEILLHEMTHVMEEPAWGEAAERSKEVKDLYEYYNDPREMRAFMQEIVARGQETYGRLRKMFDTAKAVELAIRSTKWGDIESYLSPRNRKYMLKGIWQGLEEGVEK